MNTIREPSGDQTADSSIERRGADLPKILAVDIDDEDAGHLGRKSGRDAHVLVRRTWRRRSAWRRATIRVTSLRHRPSSSARRSDHWRDPSSRCRRGRRTPGIGGLPQEDEVLPVAREGKRCRRHRHGSTQPVSTREARCRSRRSSRTSHCPNRASESRQATSRTGSGRSRPSGNNSWAPVPSEPTIHNRGVGQLGSGSKPRRQFVLSGMSVIRTNAIQAPAWYRCNVGLGASVTADRLGRRARGDHRGHARARGHAGLGLGPIGSTAGLVR